MKQQDIATIIIVVAIAGVFSFIVSSKFITPSSDKKTAETVQKITPEFTLPDKAIFNSEAINPTVRIEISPTENGQPFNEQTD